MTWAKTEITFFELNGTYDAADIVIFGAPFDATSSYRSGSRDASRIMRAESFGLESFSLYQKKDLKDYAVFDGGDLELPIADVSKMLAIIEQRTGVVLEDGKCPLMIGGEHLVTLGAVRAALNHYPDLAVIQFDAHADLRDSYLGETLSHATVMRRCAELLKPQSLYQLGLRSADRKEWQWGEQNTWRHPFDLNGLDVVVRDLKDRPIYLTVDLDVLDPTVLPGTGTPEAGGVSFFQLLEAIKRVFELNVVACDLCELSPVLDPAGVSTATALKVLRELLLAWAGK